MICKINFGERVLLVGHNPPTVYATTAEHIEHAERKSDGHYSRETMVHLVGDGHAVVYNEEALRDILDALPFIVHGCPEV